MRKLNNLTIFCEQIRFISLGLQLLVRTGGREASFVVRERLIENDKDLRLDKMHFKREKLQSALVWPSFFSWFVIVDFQSVSFFWLRDRRSVRRHLPLQGLFTSHKLAFNMGYFIDEIDL